MLSEQGFEMTLLHLFLHKNPITQCYPFKCQGDFCINKACDQQATESEKLNTENWVKNWAQFSCVLTKWILSLRLALGSAAQWLSKCWQAVHSPRAPSDALGIPCRALPTPQPQQHRGLSPCCRAPFPLPHLLWWWLRCSGGRSNLPWLQRADAEDSSQEKSNIYSSLMGCAHTLAYTS